MGSGLKNGGKLRPFCARCEWDKRQKTTLGIAKQGKLWLFLLDVKGKKDEKTCCLEINRLFLGHGRFWCQAWNQGGKKGAFSGLLVTPVGGHFLFLCRFFFFVFSEMLLFIVLGDFGGQRCLSQNRHILVLV